MKNKIFTTSWDDGQKLDKQLVELLEKYQIKGTFYIAKNYLSKRMSDQEIIDLSKKFEIGAHTINHPELTTISHDEALEEVVNSKKWLEELLGNEVTSFCYPRGDFNASTKEIIKKSGFKIARTVRAFKLDFEDPFEMDTTLHVYPYPWRRKDGGGLKFRGGILGFQINKFRKALDFGVPLLKNYSWLSMAKASFDVFMKKGGVFHLWGHSWEIDKYKMWGDLGLFLKYVKESPGLIFTSNSEMLNSKK